MPVQPLKSLLLLMKNALWWFALIALLGGSAVVFYHVLERGGVPLSPQVRTEPRPAPQVELAQTQDNEPHIRHPIEQVQARAETQSVPEPEVAEESLPALDESDAAMRASLAGLLGDGPVSEYLVAQHLVRRIVSTVDNLTSDKVALKARAFRRVEGPFLVAETADGDVISPKNYARYTPYVRLAEAVDTGSLVAVYLRFYPLFQQAYADLGYPSGYFNDRLVDVIDDLLATPAVLEPIRLVRPRVLYQFEDPALEACSAGQKMLLRMGNENATRIKTVLHEIRRQLTGRGARREMGIP
jgi:hypothetical protein